MGKQKQSIGAGRPSVPIEIWNLAVDLLAEQRLSPKQIADQLGIGLTKVYEIRRSPFKKLALPTPPPPPVPAVAVESKAVKPNLPKVRMTVEQWNRVVELLAQQEMSAKKISKMLGIGVTKVYEVGRNPYKKEGAPDKPLRAKRPRKAKD